MLREERLFIVIAEKSRKLVMWKAENYYAKAGRQLSDRVTYEKLTEALTRELYDAARRKNKSYEASLYDLLNLCLEFYSAFLLSLFFVSLNQFIGSSVRLICNETTNMRR